jgi:hypothetical protein
MLARATVLSALASLSVFASLGPLVASDYDLLINEVHYHPLSGDRRDEYVEIYNRGGIAVDLTEWAVGRGILLPFPAGTRIGPKSYIIASPDAAYTAARYNLDPDIVVGDYTGSLDNGGEIIALYSADGEVISEIHYGDGGVWPSASDGTGPSLELTDPFSQIKIPQNWRASGFLDGTPGAPNSVLDDTIAAPNETVLIEEDETWSYFKGTEAFPSGWNELGFNDTAWDSGATGIGYADDDDRTVLEDMEDGYLSFAARKVFQFTQEERDSLGRVVLSVDYDDSFVMFLNGAEIVRANIGNSGDDTPFDAEADGSRESGTSESFTISRGLFRVGANVLAAQIHNQAIDSSDASFVPRLVSLPTATIDPSDNDLGDVVINEIKATEKGSPGFIELFNRTTESIDIGGFEIVDTNDNRFIIPGGVAIDGQGHMVFSDETLGFDIEFEVVRYALLGDDGRSWVDGINPRPGDPDENGFSFGRFPDGDNDAFVLVSPSSGSANGLSVTGDVVVNEIYYHPPFVATSKDCERNCSDPLQWIELHNRRSDAAIPLTDWELTKGLVFEFPVDANIAAGGYLVITSDRTAFLDAHPGVDPAMVLGDWSRDLSHNSDTLNLRDELGNLVDHIKYGDGKPRNDEEEEDGVDDRTFLGSDWPLDSDGTGSSIELIHPYLNNRLGGAWASSAVGGTPGAENGTFDATPAPAIGQFKHLPPIPTSAADIVVSARVTAVGALTSVEAQWEIDGGGGSGTVALVDDGTSGDERAGDDIYSGVIAAQDAGSVISVRVEAISAGGTTRVPLSPDVAPYEGFDGPTYLVPVLDDAPLDNPSPDYYIVMSAADQAELEGRDVDSNVLLNCTFISRSKQEKITVRHLSGLRYRGSGTRDNIPRSYRIEFPPERTFEGVEAINLNANDIEHEMLASDLFLRAGLAAPIVRTANLTFQGDTIARYVRKERIDGDFLTRAFGGASDGGNLYRAFDPSGASGEGDLTYYGEDPEDYRPYYDKRSNDEADDFSDIIELTRVLDATETPDEDFVAALEAVIDVYQWARFFAIQAAIANDDGGIQSSSGEDYFLYKIPSTSNFANRGKWVLLPWDIEESYDDDDEVLFRPEITAVRRFLRHQRFAPIHYCNLMNVRFGVFSRLETRQRFRLIDFLFSFSTIDRIDRFITSRIGFFDENIPMHISAGSSDIQGGAFIAEGDDWRYFKGTEEPSGGTTAWTEIDFDDDTWDVGPSGFGYDDGDDATLLDDMEDGYTTLYIRKEFEVADASALLDLELWVDYDDGFTAYLNGTEVARADFGEVGTPEPFDGDADGTHEAGAADLFDLTKMLDLLVDGTNVLAIQGANGDLGSSDFSLIPELRSGASSAAGIGCGRVMYATAETIQLKGLANACDTRRVEVNGVEAPYDAFLAEWAISVDLDPGVNIIVVETFDAFGNPFERYEIEVRRAVGALSVVEGSLAGTTTWTAADGPYLMRDDVTIPSGARLVIEPGTIVYGSGGASIIVRGEFDAQGTEADPILFRAAGCDGRWGGIAFDATGSGNGDYTHILRYCDSEFGDNPSGYDGHVAPVDSKILVDSCSFRLLTANAIDGTDARLEVMDCLFEDIQEGVHGSRSVVIVLDSTFRNMVGDKDAIDFDLNGSEVNRIERCLFVNSSDDGIDLGDTTVEIRDNIFVNMQDKALSLEDDGAFGASTITGNLLYNNGTAIALKSGVHVDEGHHNTLVGNQEGVSLYAKDDASDGGHATFHSMIIWNNAFDVKIDSLSTVTFTHSNISERSWPGEDNISMDPRFADVLNGDYSLTKGSPSIGTGLGGTQMGAVPFMATPTGFTRGDVDEDGNLDITDMVSAANYLFRGGVGPACRDRLDANDDGSTDVSDVVFGLLYLFAGGGEPPAPFLTEGPDPTPDALPCP